MREGAELFGPVAEKRAGLRMRERQPRWLWIRP